MIINYTFADGHKENIEVTEEFAAAYAEADKQFRRNERKFAWRKLKREESYEAMQEAFGFEPQDDALSVEDVAASDDFVARFTACLTKKQEQIFRKVFIECKSLRTAAAEAGISLHTLQRHIFLIEKKYLNYFAE